MFFTRSVTTACQIAVGVVTFGVAGYKAWVHLENKKIKDEYIKRIDRILARSWRAEDLVNIENKLDAISALAALRTTLVMMKFQADEMTPTEFIAKYQELANNPLYKGVDFI